MPTRGFSEHARALLRIAEIVFISYGTRILQMGANVYIARVSGASPYTMYQTIQQLILSVFFYSSLGITYSFSSQVRPTDNAQRLLTFIYAGSSSIGALAAVMMVRPLITHQVNISSTIVFLASLIYSAYGLANALVVRKQMFRLSATSGFISPFLLLIYCFFARDGAIGADLALLSLSGPIAAYIPLIFNREKANTDHENPHAKIDGKTFTECLSGGIFIALPVAGQGAVYTMFLLAGGYRNESEAVILALLMPLYNLLLIGPSALMNLILFNKENPRPEYVILPAALASLAVLATSSSMIRLTLSVMGSRERISTSDSFAYVFFCVLMVFSKVCSAFTLRGTNRGWFTLSILPLFGIVSSLFCCLLYYFDQMSLYSALVNCGIFSLAPYIFLLLNDKRRRSIDG